MSAWSGEVCRGLVQDYFQLTPTAPPHFAAALRALPTMAPLFTANLITTLSQLYAKVGKFVINMMMVIMVIIVMIMIVMIEMLMVMVMMILMVMLMMALVMVIIMMVKVNHISKRISVSLQYICFLMNNICLFL